MNFTHFFMFNSFILFYFISFHTFHYCCKTPQTTWLFIKNTGTCILKKSVECQGASWPWKQSFDKRFIKKPKKPNLNSRLIFSFLKLSQPIGHIRALVVTCAISIPYLPKLFPWQLSKFCPLRKTIRWHWKLQKLKINSDFQRFLMGKCVVLLRLNKQT